MSERYSLPKLCIVSSYEFSDTNATKARLTVYLDILSQYFEIVFLCPAGSDIPVNDRVKIYNVGQAPARGDFFLRAVREIIYALRTLKVMRSLKPDIALVSSPSIFLLGLSTWKKCPIIFDVRDITWEYLSEGSFFQRLIKYIIRLFSRSMLAKSDMIIVTNYYEYEYMKRMLESKLLSVPIEIVSNGISLQRFTSLHSMKKNHETDTHMLLYVGNVGLAQDLTTLIDAVILHPEITVKVIGKGTDLERIQQYTRDRQTANIEFVGGVSWEKLGEYYAQADILYAQITSGYESAIPSKLYEYLSLDVPVIYGGVGAAADLAKEFENIEVIEPSNSQILSDALERAKKMKGIHQGHHNSNRIKEKYLREGQVKKVVDKVCSLVKQTKNL